MTARQKVIGSLAVLFSLFLLSFVVLSATLIRGAFLDLEESEAFEQVERLSALLKDQADGLAAVTRDYAGWDATWNFATGNAPSFVMENLPDEVLDNLRLSFLFIFTLDGRLAESRARDIDGGRPMAPDAKWVRALHESGLVTLDPAARDARSGILLVDGIPCLVSSHPVLHNDMSGPAAGSLAFGRFLDGAELTRLGAQGRSPLILRARGPSDQPSGTGAGTARPSVKRTRHEGELVVQSPFPDLLGRPSMVLETRLPREIFRRWQATNRFFTGYLAAAGALAILFVLFLVDVHVLRPMARLGAQVTSMASQGTRPSDLPVDGDDEVAILARSFSDSLLTSDRLRLEAVARGERFSSHFAEAPTGNHISDPEGLIVQANPALRRILGVAEDATDLRWPDFFTSPEAWQSHLALLRGRGRIDFQQHELVARGKGRIMVVETAVAAFSGDGRLEGFHGYIYDVTEAARLADTLRQRERLIKEIHHRTKNQFLAISSFLQFHALHVASEKDAALFNECQTRIRTMAATHQFLSEVGSSGRIEVERFVSDLTRHLRLIYHVGRSRVAFTVEARGITLNEDTAHPFGLIITELVANAVKSAFPAGRPGQVTIRVQRRENNGYRLTVSDDGVGLPEGFDLRSQRTLGFTLVQALAEQLGGSVRVLPQPTGACIEVVFKEHWECSPKEL